MTFDAKKLLDEVLSLDRSDRATLAARLINSLDLEAESSVESAWACELERRVEELDSGAVATIPWEEVRERLHRTLNETS